MNFTAPSAKSAAASDAPYTLVAPRRSFRWGRLITILVCLACLPFLLVSSEGARGLLALSVAGILLGLLKRSAPVGVACTVGYLALLGGLRRWLIPVYDWSPVDPMIVAAPLAAVAFLVVTHRNYRPGQLTRWIIGILGLMAVEMVNPLQGGLAVGLSGGLFYIAPMLWYFIGRQVGSPGLVHRLGKTVIVVAILAALYGLYQTFFGFNYAERLWIQITKEAYMALSVNGVIRAFSFFTSAAEYSAFLSLGIVLLWAAFLRGHRLALVAIALLGVALFLESVRGAIVGSLGTCVILWALQGRTMAQWVPRGAIGLAIAVAVGFWGLNHLAGGDYSSKTNGLIQHQVSGLLNATDQTQSTATGHVGIFVNGVANGFHNPIGLGLGSTTIAGQKFGGVEESTEVDISNMFVSMGFIGGLAYIVIIVMVLIMALRYWVRTRTLAALWILGILLALLGGWLNGGQYATCMLAWVTIGILDRLQQQAPSAVEVTKQTLPPGAIRLPEYARAGGRR